MPTIVAAVAAVIWWLVLPGTLLADASLIVVVRRPGDTGEARVILRRSMALDAAWWALRGRLRTDLLR